MIPLRMLSKRIEHKSCIELTTNRRSVMTTFETTVPKVSNP